MNLFKSPYAILLYIVTGVVLFVVFPSPERHQKEPNPRQGYGEALEMIASECEKKFEVLAVELNTDFLDGAASWYCTCVAIQGLQSAETDDEAVELANAIVSVDDFLTSFIRSESVYRQCVPEE